MSAPDISIEPAAAEQFTVQRYLSGVVACVSPDATLAEVARKLMAIEAGALIVGTVDDIAGMISERDVVRMLGLRHDVAEVRAGDVARTDLVWCAPSATPVEVGRVMAAQGVRHVLVGERGRLAGIISARDIIDATCA